MRVGVVMGLIVALLWGGVVLSAQDVGEGGASGATPAEPIGPGGRTPDAALHDALFYVFAGVAVISCLGIVFSGNIVRTATWLLGTLGAVAALFFLMLANFLGAIQLIVYAGGILVLIVFGVMLTSKSPWMRFDARPAEVVGGCVVCGALLIGLVSILLRTDWARSARPNESVVSVAEFGRALLTEYLLPFEVASVLLLAVMIGAAYLARPEK
jgi:NADH-quinone oxidoreductase subunit J